MEVILALLISLGVFSADEAYSYSDAIDAFIENKALVMESGEDFQGILAHCDQEGDL